MDPQRLPRSNRSPDALEERLRALPPPPVPGCLETRLLAAIPAEDPSERPRSVPPARLRFRNRTAWAGAALALAAACVLCVLFVRWTSDPTAVVRRDTDPEPTRSHHELTPQRPGDSAAITLWLEAQRGLDDSEGPTFIWPIREKRPLMASTSIPPDLFD